MSFALSRAFIDRSDLVVPTAGEVPYGNLVKAAGGKVEVIKINVPPVTAEVDVPFDGVHVELAPGNCILPDVPPAQAEIEVGELSVKDVRADIPT